MESPVKLKSTVRGLPVRASKPVKAPSPVTPTGNSVQKVDEPKAVLKNDVQNVKEKAQLKSGPTRRVSGINKVFKKDVPSSPKTRPKITKEESKEKFENIAKSPSESSNSSPQRNPSWQKIRPKESSRTAQMPKTAKKIDLEMGFSTTKILRSNRNVGGQRNSSKISQTGRTLSEKNSKTCLREDFENIFENMKKNASDREVDFLETGRQRFENMYYKLATSHPDLISEEDKSKDDQKQLGNLLAKKISKMPSSVVLEETSSSLRVQEVEKNFLINNECDIPLGCETGESLGNLQDKNVINPSTEKNTLCSVVPLNSVDEPQVLVIVDVASIESWSSEENLLSIQCPELPSMLESSDETGNEGSETRFFRGKGFNVKEIESSGLAAVEKVDNEVPSSVLSECKDVKAINAREERQDEQGSGNVETTVESKDKNCPPSAANPLKSYLDEDLDTSFVKVSPTYTVLHNRPIYASTRSVQKHDPLWSTENGYERDRNEIKIKGIEDTHQLLRKTCMETDFRKIQNFPNSGTDGLKSVNIPNDVVVSKAESSEKMSAEDWMKAFLKRMSEEYEFPSKAKAVGEDEDDDDIDRENAEIVENISKTQILFQLLEDTIEAIGNGLAKLSKRYENDLKRPIQKGSKLVQSPGGKLPLPRIADMGTNRRLNLVNRKLKENPRQYSTCRKILGSQSSSVTSASSASSASCASSALCKPIPKLSSCKRNESELASKGAKSYEKRVTWDSIKELSQQCQKEVLIANQPSSSGSELAVVPVVIKAKEILRCIKELHASKKCKSSDEDRTNIENSKKERKTPVDLNVSNFVGCPCMMDTVKSILQQAENTVTESE